MSRMPEYVIDIEGEGKAAVIKEILDKIVKMFHSFEFTVSSKGKKHTVRIKFTINDESNIDATIAYIKMLVKDDIGIDIPIELDLKK